MRNLYLLFFLLSFVQQANAQRITAQYNNVSFSEALKDLNARQDKYTINFVYDELEDFKVSKSHSKGELRGISNYISNIQHWCDRGDNAP